MEWFIIQADESWCDTKDGNRKKCLEHDTKAFFHSDYEGGGKWREDGTIENMICTLKNDRTPYTDNVLKQKVEQLVRILREDLPKIPIICSCSQLTVCVIPRAKKEEHYADNQRLFKLAVSKVAKQCPSLIDGTSYIKRRTDTRTTHSDRSGNGGNGPRPYCGITNDTCSISNISGKNILLVDDLYTKTICIDEDCIQALYDNGARNVFFYSVGKTISRW